jgi:hypothetical protein
MGFFLVVLVWTLLWLGWNFLAQIRCVSMHGVAACGLQWCDVPGRRRFGARVADSRDGQIET